MGSDGCSYGKDEEAETERRYNGLAQDTAGTLKVGGTDGMGNLNGVTGNDRVVDAAK